MKTAKINLNWNCLIQEWPRGVEAFNEYHKQLGLDPEGYRKMHRQSDGRLKMPLWQVANIYGATLYMGPQPPISPEVEILLEGE